MIELSKPFSLNINDWLKTLFMLVFAAIVAPIYMLITQQGFDIFSVDWSALMHTEINVIVVTVVAYLLKNYISDAKGIPFGRAHYADY